MLNIEVNRSAEGVERYFDRELAVSDYLMKEPFAADGTGETIGVPCYLGCSIGAFRADADPFWK